MSARGANQSYMCRVCRTVAVRVAIGRAVACAWAAPPLGHGGWQPHGHSKWWAAPVHGPVWVSSTQQTVFLLNGAAWGGGHAVGVLSVAACAAMPPPPPPQHACAPPHTRQCPQTACNADASPLRLNALEHKLKQWRNCVQTDKHDADSSSSCRGECLPVSDQPHPKAEGQAAGFSSFTQVQGLQILG